jgi:hypothetical protein
MVQNFTEIFNNKAGWPNGKALDYESRDCRFDPCVGQFFGVLGKRPTSMGFLLCTWERDLHFWPLRGLESEK